MFLLDFLLNFSALSFYFLLLCGFGHFFINRIDTDPIARLFVSFFIGMAFFGLGHLILALLGMASPLMMSVLPIIGVLGALLYRNDILKELFSFWYWLSDYLFKDDRWTKPFLIFFGLFLLWIALLCLLPERGGDALRYHLAQLKDIASNQALLFRPYYCYNFPLHFSFTFFPLYVFLGETAIIYAVMGTFIVSLALTLRLAFYLRLRSSRLLLLFISFTPISYWEATGMLNDWAVIMFALLGFLFLLEPSFKDHRVAVFLGFFALGACLGTKYHAILFVPWFLWLAKKRLQVKFSLKGQLFILLLACIVMGVLPALYYIRNFINTGSPVWPLMQTVFTSSGSYLYEVSMAYSREFKGEHSLNSILISLKQIVSYRFIPVTMWFLALLGVLFRKRSQLDIGIGFALFFGLWWIIQPRYYWRFSIFVMPIAAIAAVRFWDWVEERKGKMLRYVTLSVFLLHLSFGIAIASYYSTDVFPYVITRNYDKYHFSTWFYRSIQWVNREVPKDSKLLIIVLSGHTYYFEHDYRRADPMLSGFLDWRKYNKVKSLVQKLKSEGITHIFYDNSKRWLKYVGGKEMRQVLKELVKTDLVKILRSEDVKLYTSRMQKVFLKSNVLVMKIN